MSAPLQIAGGQLAEFRLPLRRQVVTAKSSLIERQVIILRLTDERGLAGLGEAAPFPGISLESFEDARASLTRLLDDGSLVGLRVRSTEDIAQLSCGLSAPASVRHAVDQALLELLAARRGVSLARLLHPGARTRVPLHALVANPAEAQAQVSRGMRTLKVKVGAEALEQDLARLSAIRRVVPAEVTLRPDANGAWGEAAAVAAITAFSELGLQCVEQPTHSLEEMARVKAQVPVPLAADESVRNAMDLEALIDLQAADAVVLKPMLAGGLTAALALADRCAAVGLPVSVTTTIESAIGRAGALEVAAAAPGTLWTSGLTTGHLLLADLEPCDGGLPKLIRGRAGALATAEPAERGGRARLTFRAPRGALARIGGSAA